MNIEAHTFDECHCYPVVEEASDAVAVSFGGESSLEHVANFLQVRGGVVAVGVEVAAWTSFRVVLRHDHGDGRHGRQEAAVCNER